MIRTVRRIYRVRRRPPEGDRGRGSTGHDGRLDRVDGALSRRVRDDPPQYPNGNGKPRAADRIRDDGRDVLRSRRLGASLEDVLPEANARSGRLLKIGLISTLSLTHMHPSGRRPPRTGAWFSLPSEWLTLLYNCQPLSRCPSVRVATDRHHPVKVEILDPNSLKSLLRKATSSPRAPVYLRGRLRNALNHRRRARVVNGLSESIKTRLEIYGKYLSPSNKDHYYY